MTVKEAVKKMIEEFEALAGIELFIANDLDEAIDNVIAAAREEGRAEERERIRKACHPIMLGVDGATSVYTVSASVLAPAPKEEK